MQNPNNLHVWNRAIDLAVRVNHFASKLRAINAPGLANQMRRASTSIPANIAEGAGQDSPQQFARFLSMAIGSAFELESHVALAQRLQPTLVNSDELISEISQIRRTMHALRAHQLRKSRNAVH